MAIDPNEICGFILNCKAPTYLRDLQGLVGDRLEALGQPRYQESQPLTLAGARQARVPEAEPAGPPTHRDLLPPGRLRLTAEQHDAVLDAFRGALSDPNTVQRARLTPEQCEDLLNTIQAAQTRGVGGTLHLGAQVDTIPTQQTQDTELLRRGLEVTAHELHQADRVVFKDGLIVDTKAISSTPREMDFLPASGGIQESVQRSLERLETLVAEERTHDAPGRPDALPGADPGPVDPGTHPGQGAGPDGPAPAPGPAA